MKNKLLVGFGVLIGLVILGGILGGDKPQVKGTSIIATPVPSVATTTLPNPAIAPTPIPIPLPALDQTPEPIVQPTVAPVQDSGLSNDNYYTNTQGNTVHSPAYSNSTPEGATAICGDGTYSFSQSRRGTCSHHGGVSQWL